MKAEKIDWSFCPRQIPKTVEVRTVYYKDGKRIVSKPRFVRLGYSSVGEFVAAVAALCAVVAAFVYGFIRLAVV